MTSTRRNDTAETLTRERVSAIIRTEDQSLAHDAMSAVVEGGFRVVEFTLTTPGAFELIADFSKRDGLIVGAGTVMTIELARQAEAAGARFLVSPIFDPIVIDEAAKLDLVSIPGAYTPTEMETAHRGGADFVKVFPAVTGGVDFIRAVRGPLPHLRLFPTAGATPENFTAFLDAGCAGVGFVRSLFEPEDMRAGRFSAIRDRAGRIISSLKQWQKR